MPRLDLEQTQRIAALARIALTPAEAAALTRELESVLAHVERIDSIEASLPSEPHARSGGYRGDRVEPSLSQQSALTPAADSKQGYLIVPRVIG